MVDIQPKKITALPQLNLPLTGSELLLTVYPGNAQQGQSYGLTTSNLFKTIGALPNYPFTIDPLTIRVAAFDQQSGLPYNLTLDQLGIINGQVPAGGTTGQVLIKASDANFDVEWSNQGAGAVASVAVGNLAPLFTANVLNPTTNPDINFEFQSAGANTWFGNSSSLGANPSFVGAGSLTKNDDINVTLTLGGDPTNSLLKSTSLTLGWTGLLSESRGGTGTSVGAANKSLSNLITTSINTDILPSTANAINVGSGALPWSGVFLGNGAPINWGNGDIILTGTANSLNFTGATNGYSFDNNILSYNSSSLGSSSIGWPNLFLSSGATINFGNGNAILTHSSGVLTLSTGDLRISTQGNNDKSVIIKETIQPYVDFINDQYFNPLLFSGVDIKAKIQAAIDAANSAGFGIIQLPSGIINAAGIVIKTGAYLHGARNYGTTIRAPNGTNGAIIISQNFGSLTGTGNNNADTPHEFGVQNLIIDGNLSNVTWSVGIQTYGYRTLFEQIQILNCKGYGFYSEWGQYGRVTMESTIRDMIVDTTGDHGIIWRGAHDSYIENVIVVDAGQTADNTYYGFYNAAQYGNARIVNLHCWHRDTVTNRVAMQCQSEGNTEYFACHFEGGRGQLRHTGQNDRVIGSFIYAPFGSGGSSMVYFNANSNQHVGCNYNNNTSQDVFAIAYNSSAAYNTVDGAYFGGFGTRTPFNFISSGGYNKIDGIGYTAPGGATSFGGTPNSNDIIHYKQGGTVIKYYRENIDYIQAANDSAAASDGVPLGGTYIDTSNQYALRIRIT